MKPGVPIADVVAVSCKTCPHAKALHLQVYCKVHPELLPLPESLGHILRIPVIQAAPPRWCPLLSRLA